MSLFNQSPLPMQRTLRVLAHLLSYPNQDLLAHLAELRTALHDEGALSAARLGEIDHLLDALGQQPTLQAEAAYVELFDRGRATALHLFEHVHGDSRDRGPAMIDLVKTYEQAGLYLRPDDLPDYLPAVLQYASTQPPAQGRAFLSEIAHIVRAIFSAVLERQSPYASVLAGLLDLAGEPALPVKLPEEQPLDESWPDPPAFDGCSTRGQARPDQPQPIHMIRRPTNNARTPGNQA